MDWHFRPKQTGDDLSDPISGEFFADGDNPASDLVREALQNAMDAGRHVDRGGLAVHVRIALHDEEAHQLPAKKSKRWFGELKNHLAAKANGLKDPPKVLYPGRFLVIEDFNTSGLTGDIHDDDTDSNDNKFLNFLRSTGRTSSDDERRGSWGIGKTVFPRSSRINGFIAYTVRSEDHLRLVMGKVILRHRKVGGVQYQPECYLSESWDDKAVPIPSQDIQIIDQLRGDFSLSRNTEPGLSVIVPWLDDVIQFQQLRDAVLEQFYYAILAGVLTVSLDHNGNVITLDRDNLPKQTQELLPKLTPAVGLAAWSQNPPKVDCFKLNAPPDDAKQKWSDDLLTPQVRVDLQQKLIRHERAAVKVPVHVPKFIAESDHEQTNEDGFIIENRETSAGTFLPIVESFFHVCFETEGDQKPPRPAFFREQLAISKVTRAPAIPGVRALVVIDDPPLARLLRAAEPPNHNDWQSGTGNFKRDYGKTDANHVITFVKTAARQIISIVRAGDNQPDPTVAIDFFAIPEPTPDPSPPGKKKIKKPGDESEKPEPIVPPKPRRIALGDIHGGFKLRPGDPDAIRPDRVHVRIAYNTFSGNPFKAYDPKDFNLEKRGRDGISIEATGDARYEVIAPNRIEVTLDGNDFELTTIGFDTNRDLKVVCSYPGESLDA